MTLTQEQRDEVEKWAAGGASLGDIQKRLQEEFGVKISYLDARLLVAELEVRLQDRNQPAPKTPSLDGQATEADEEPSSDSASQGLVGGKVNLTVDSVAQPHALVSGRVTFSDGKKAVWYVDQMGRLGLTADEASYRPSQQDLMEFQRELQTAMRKQGF